VGSETEHLGGNRLPRRFRELASANAASRYGFMAMQYNNPQLDAIVREHFVPQLRLAGFDLQRLDQGQGAGLIDDQLRLRIRQAKFLVCDLSHGNRGAHWEAGYAEGLGIPVIYTCRRDVFENPTHEFRPHFDAAHWVTVPWDPADPALAAIKLKITVRATLPTEAQLQD
jgi:nucleoside 2-deoxyribosyltransferase